MMINNRIQHMFMFWHVFPYEICIIVFGMFTYYIFMCMLGCMVCVCVWCKVLEDSYNCPCAFSTFLWHIGAFRGGIVGGVDYPDVNAHILYKPM